MKVGIGIHNCREGKDYPTGFTTPKELVELAKLAERLGFDSLWADHHINPDIELLKETKSPPNFFDPLITLSHLAAATHTIRLGTAVLVMIWADPVFMAKQIATLDVLSGGRLLLGMGIGGSRREFEMANPRLSQARRGDVFDEQLSVFRLILTQDDVVHEGRFYSFHGLTLHPRPLQEPMPLYFSGNSPSTVRRIAQFGQGCFVDSNEEAVRQRIQALEPLLENAGRGTSDIDIVTPSTISIARTPQEALSNFHTSPVSRYRKNNVLIGTPSEIAEQIQTLGKAGLTHFTAQRFGATTFASLKEQVQMFGEEVLPFVR